MKNRIYKQAGWVLSLTMIASAAVGCRENLNVGDSSATSTGTTTSTVGGAVNQVATTDAFKVLVDFQSASSTYKYFLHAQGAAFSSSSCSVVSGSSLANSDIYCFVDVNELDLFMGGLSLRFNAPPGMCAYTKVKLYHYWGAQAGAVPSSTVCTVDTNTGTGAVTQSCSGGSNLTWDGAEYVCDYDYTANQGPNCCEGQYTLQTSTTSGGTTTFNSPTTVKMTGSLANCLVGPGKDVPGYQTAKGWPANVYYNTPDGQNTRLDFTAPIKNQRASILYVANYWDPLDYNRNGLETGTFPSVTKTNVPLAFQSISSNTYSYMPNPYYEFGCMDAADDYVARIRVLVRAWDSVSNFNANSNPYTDPTTNEPGFNSDYYINDRSAWADFSPTHVNATFGDHYPGMSY